jgi:hypothetical protein
MESAISESTEEHLAPEIAEDSSKNTTEEKLTFNFKVLPTTSNNR